MIIVLLGYMGSGKSVIGKKLSEILHFDFVDLDHFIESKENKSISEIFKIKGEIYFRNKESEYLQQLLKRNDDIVLALGGGTPCYSGNMLSITKARNSRSIYLKASIGTLEDRLTKEKAKRPLLEHIQTKAELTEFIGKHLFERIAFYDQAELTVETNEKTVIEIVEKIILKLL